MCSRRGPRSAISHASSKSACALSGPVGLFSRKRSQARVRRPRGSSSCWPARRRPATAASSSRRAVGNVAAEVTRRKPSAADGASAALRRRTTAQNGLVKRDAAQREVVEGDLEKRMTRVCLNPLERLCRALGDDAAGFEQGSARALACSNPRPRGLVRARGRLESVGCAGDVSGEGAGNSTRGACAPHTDLPRGALGGGEEQAAIPEAAQRVEQRVVGLVFFLHLLGHAEARLRLGPTARLVQGVGVGRAPSCKNWQPCSRKCCSSSRFFMARPAWPARRSHRRPRLQRGSIPAIPSPPPGWPDTPRGFPPCPLAPGMSRHMAQ